MKKLSKNDCKTILLIEDDQTWVSLIREILPKPVQVDAVSTLQDAIKANLSQYHLILMDLILPDSLDPMQSFLRLFQEIRTHQHPPLIVISAQDSLSVQQEITEYGIFGYMDKGEWNLRVFMKMIDDALNEQSVDRYARHYRGMVTLLNRLSQSDIKQLSTLFL